jgi:hypothetical protein
LAVGNFSSPSPDGTSETYESKFNQAFSDDEPLRRQARLASLSEAFINESVSTARLIISELATPVTQQTVACYDVGGVAGGNKFTKNGILYKVIISDPTSNGVFLYGGAQARLDLAAKEAGHALRGAQFYHVALSSLKRLSPQDPDFCEYAPYLAKVQLHVPMTVVIDFRGFRVTAHPLLSLDSCPPVYGSSDGGETVYADPILHKLFEFCSKHSLHSALHGVLFDQGPLWTAADMECRLAKNESIDCNKEQKDGRGLPVPVPVRRVTIIDLARVFPPEDFRAATHLPQVGGSVFYRLLRPEFVHLWKKLQRPRLSPDALSNFGLGHDSAEHNANAFAATRYLLDSVVPAFVEDVLQKARRLKENEFASLSALFASSELHAAGINIRHMGFVRRQLQERIKMFNQEMDAGLAQRLLLGPLLHMVARTLKVLARSLCRELTLRNEHNASFFDHIANFVNKVIANSEAVWDTVLTHLLEKFGSCALHESNGGGAALHQQCQPILPAILQLMSAQTPLGLSEAALRDFETSMLAAEPGARSLSPRNHPHSLSEVASAPDKQEEVERAAKPLHCDPKDRYPTLEDLRRKAGLPPQSTVASIARNPADSASFISVAYLARVTLPHARLPSQTVQGCRSGTLSEAHAGRLMGSSAVAVALDADQSRSIKTEARPYRFSRFHFSHHPVKVQCMTELDFALARQLFHEV